MRAKRTGSTLNVLMVLKLLRAKNDGKGECSFVFVLFFSMDRDLTSCMVELLFAARVV